MINIDNLKKETEYLFNCDFDSDDYDANESYEHYNRAASLMNSYKWQDIFPVWFDYLKEKCHFPKEVINYVNLYMYYGGQDEIVADPYDFLGCIYSRVDMDIYWDDCGELFDGLAISILEHSGRVNTFKDPYYSPLKDKKLMNSIEIWKIKNNG